MGRRRWRVPGVRGLYVRIRKVVSSAVDGGGAKPDVTAETGAGEGTADSTTVA